MLLMRQQQSDEDQGTDEFLLQEYEHFLAGKAEGTSDVYGRTMPQVMEGITPRSGNEGIFHPGKLTKACNRYLAHQFTKLPASSSLVPSNDVFWLLNFPKVLFLKLARILVLFLIL